MRNMQEEVKELNDKNGWTPSEKDLKCKWFIPGKLILSISEYIELLEGYRNNDIKNIGEELADIGIRLYDLANILGIDLDNAIIDKMDINWTRGYKHGGKLF